MATIRIMSGGAPKEIFLQLTPQFERQSGHKVEYVFAVMSALRDKLAAGEKADVLVMPTNILDGYQKDNVVRALGRAVLGLVPINAVVRTGAAKPDLSTPREGQARDAQQPRHHACDARGDTERHAYGETGRAARHRRRDERQNHPSPALEGGVQLVANGEAEIAFIRRARSSTPTALTVVGPLPAAIQLTTSMAPPSPRRARRPTPPQRLSNS